MLKKVFLFLITLICFNVFVAKVEAQILAITPIGSPIITETTVTQNFLMRLREFREWELTVKTQEPYWVNVESPTYKIPATNTEITTSDGTFRLVENTEIEIYEGDFSPYTTVPFSVKVDNINGAKSGLYNLNLDFSINGEVFTYTMSIFIPPTLDITTTVPTSYINLTEADVFNLQSVTQNVVDTQINIKANGKWNLYLDTTNLGNIIGNYTYEVLGGEGKNLVILSKAINSLRAGNNILIASGDSSYTDFFPSTEIPTYLRIRYALNNNTLEYFDEGSFTNNLIYRIEEK